MADEVLRDRVIPARVERLADEVGLPAEAGEILLVGGEDSRVVGSLRLSRVL